MPDFHLAVNEILLIFLLLVAGELSANFYASFADNHQVFMRFCRGFDYWLLIGKFSSQQQQAWLQSGFVVDVDIAELDLAGFADDKYRRRR